MLETVWDPPISRLQAGFGIMADGLADMRVPLALAALIAARDSSNRFAQEGPGWAPWSEDYAIEVQNNPAHHGSLLWLSGDMRGKATDPGSYLVTNNALAYDFAAGKESTHQFGSRTTPARPYVGLSASGEDEVVAMFMEWVVSQTADVPSAGGLSVATGETFLRRGRMVQVSRSSLGTFMSSQVIG